MNAYIFESALSGWPFFFHIFKPSFLSREIVNIMTLLCNLVPPLFIVPMQSYITVTPTNFERNSSYS